MAASPRIRGLRTPGALKSPMPAGDTVHIAFAVAFSLPPTPLTLISDALHDTSEPSGTPQIKLRDGDCDAGDGVAGVLPQPKAATDMAAISEAYRTDSTSSLHEKRIELRRPRPTRTSTERHRRVLEL